MAELTITAGSFRNINCGTAKAIAGEAMTRGQYIYIDSVSGKAWLAQRDGQAFEARVAGVVTGDFAAGQEITYLLPGGDFVPGGTLAAAFAYYLGGATARGTVEISGASVPASTHYGTIVFLAKSTTVARLVCIASDAVAA
jgi:hypothetical protein